MDLFFYLERESGHSYDLMDSESLNEGNSVDTPLCLHKSVIANLTFLEENQRDSEYVKHKKIRRQCKISEII